MQGGGSSKGNDMTRLLLRTSALVLLGTPAFGGTATRTFKVGAVVVRSATISTTLTAKDGVRIQQVASRGTAAPVVITRAEAEPFAAAVGGRDPSGSDVIVTVLY